jgi:hypothetical protein
MQMRARRELWQLAPVRTLQLEQADPGGRHFAARDDELQWPGQVR